MPLQINAKRFAGLTRLLVLVLIFSTAAPCGLIEVAAASFCTGSLVESLSMVEQSSTDGPISDEAPAASEAGNEAEPVHLDCCDGCLMCCASYTAAPAPKPLVLLDAVVQPRSFADQVPSGSPFSIWHPPRA